MVYAANGGAKGDMWRQNGGNGGRWSHRHLISVMDHFRNPPPPPRSIIACNSVLQCFPARTYTSQKRLFKHTPYKVVFYNVASKEKNPITNARDEEDDIICCNELILYNPQINNCFSDSLWTSGGN